MANVSFSNEQEFMATMQRLNAVPFQNNMQAFMQFMSVMQQINAAPFQNNMQAYMQFMAHISNPANYKQTRKKQYQIWACRPAKGTKVFNKLEQAPYTTDDTASYVLTGTRGEMWTIKESKLISTYDFATGNAITTESLVEARNKQGGVIDWFKVATKKDDGSAPTYFACYVPLCTQFCIPAWGTVLKGNAPGIPHGKGDFIICPAVNGQPNFADRWIVNGAVFADTYDNRGFVDCLSPNPNSGEVPKPRTLLRGNFSSASQEGIAIAQRAAREITGRLKQIGSTIPSSLAQKCGVNLSDFKYDCKAVQVPLDLGKQILTDSMGKSEDRLKFVGASMNHLNPTMWSNEFRQKIKEFMASLHAVACFDVIEAIECQTLGLEFKKHNVRCVIVIDSNKKYYCMVIPDSKDLDVVVAALDGSLKKPLADELFSDGFNWLTIAPTKTMTFMLRNLNTILKPVLSQLDTPIEGIEVVKKPIENFKYRYNTITPNVLYEIHGSGSTRDNIYGYLAICQLPWDKGIFRCLFYPKDKGELVDDCCSQLAPSNVYNLVESLLLLIGYFRKGFQECLKGIDDNIDEMYVLRDALRDSFRPGDIFECYSKAARSRTIKLPSTMYSEAKLPSSIFNGGKDLMLGIPLKDVPIEKFIIPSEKLHINPLSTPDQICDFYLCEMVMILLTDVLIDYYESNPRKFLLSENDRAGCYPHIDGCFLDIRALNAYLRYEYHVLTRYEDGRRAEQAEVRVNWYEIHKKYFRTGRTLSQVAKDCFAHEKELSVLKDYMIKTMDYRQKD